MVTETSRYAMSAGGETVASILALAITMTALLGCTRHGVTTPATEATTRVATEGTTNPEAPVLEQAVESGARIGNVRVRFATFEADGDYPRPSSRPALVAAMVGSPPPPPRVDDGSFGAFLDLVYEAYPIPQEMYWNIQEQAADSAMGRSHEDCGTELECHVHAAVVEDVTSNRVLRVIELSSPCGGIPQDDVSSHIEVHTTEGGASIFVITWDDTEDDPRGRCGCNAEQRTAHVVVLDQQGQPIVQEEVLYMHSECATSDDYGVAWRDVDGDGKQELVGEVGRWFVEETYANDYDDEAAGGSSDAEGDDQAAEVDDAEPQREAWFVHHFDDPAALRAAYADLVCAPPPAPEPPAVVRTPTRARARPTPPRRSQRDVRRELHRNLARCENDNAPACLAAAAQLRTLQRVPWAEVAERMAMVMALVSCVEEDECHGQLGPGAFSTDAHPHVRAALAHWCQDSGTHCLALAAFNLASGSNVEATEAFLLAYCEDGPSFAACQMLEGRAPEVWRRAARVLCPSLHGAACEESARTALLEGRPLTLLEHLYSPRCPE